ncbi:OTU deubiquitinase with linear linkage specificity b isoform X1 [Hoplias malabaricus]|uniref:OTU deubiquitinase with linear linkage specificity b isoform X1 n=1 Tax=Hoplias malabaricus TaxID=27720 RepID=UPI003461EB41
MKPGQTRGKSAQKSVQNHKSNKAKSTREAADHSPDSTGRSQSKKSKKIQGPTLDNPSKTGHAAGQLGSCSTEHGEAGEMTSDPQPTQKAEEAKQCQEGLSGAEDENSDVDLYRGEEEIEEEEQEKHRSHAATSAPVVEDQSSVSAPECLLFYSQREWKGNTSKSRLIKKGYEAVALKFESLRRVRGDNYCALRATLFQILSQTQKLPAWLQGPEVHQWPKQMQPVQDLVDQWRFPVDSRKGGSAVEHLENCLQLLQSRWQEAVKCVSPVERERVCQQVFVGQKEEYELLEALKFLMLKTAVQLHSDMEKSSLVPDFCWLLFARDTSKCPRSFLINHLKHVGFSGGLEQVEMFLLGYSLQQTLQVYRLYKTDTEEFITYYPDDHKTDWPLLSLVTEDDRHYNVPVLKQAKQQSSKFDSSGRPVWNAPSGGQAQDRYVTHL